MDIVLQSVCIGKVDVVERLIKTSPVDLNQIILGECLLLAAVSLKNYEMVNLLVKNGANINNKMAKTYPLFLAIESGNIEMVSLLLELGADIHEGWIYDNGKANPMPPLHFAVHYLKLKSVLLLLSKGADVNVRNNNMLTALHVVANLLFLMSESEVKKNLKTLVEIAAVLLDRGADVNAKDSDGTMPLDYVVTAQNSEFCKLFIREGAQVKKVKSDGSHYEYISCVIMYRCPELSRLCLERGCSYNICDEKSLNPYQGSLYFGNPDSIKVFWQFGCPYDQPETAFNPTWMPIGEASKKLLAAQKSFINGVKNNCLESVKTSLMKGAEPKGGSMDIPSTLHYVAAKNNHELAKLLMREGVAVNKTNDNGETPFYVASKKGNLNVSRVLLQFGACYNYNYGKEALNEHLKKTCQVQCLRQKIHRYFGMVKKNDTKIAKLLRKYTSSENKEELLVLMNCVNRRGVTLMGEALRLGHVQVARELMLLRIEFM